MWKNLKPQETQIHACMPEYTESARCIKLPKICYFWCCTWDPSCPDCTRKVTVSPALRMASTACSWLALLRSTPHTLATSTKLHVNTISDQISVDLFLKNTLIIQNPSCLKIAMPRLSFSKRQLVKNYISKFLTVDNFFYLAVLYTQLKPNTAEWHVFPVFTSLWWVCARRCSFRFLFLADRSGTWH